MGYVHWQQFFKRFRVHIEHSMVLFYLVFQSIYVITIFVTYTMSDNCDLTSKHQQS